MPDSGIIDVAIGMVFVFATTAALSSVITELIARFLGLRGAYLLRGLRTLIDGDERATLGLSQVKDSYEAFKNILVLRQKATDASTASNTAAQAAEQAKTDADNDPGNPQLKVEAQQAELAAKARAAVAQHADDAAQAARPDLAAVLGSPILRNQGMADQIHERQLKLEQNKITKTSGGVLVTTWSQLRDLPSYIPARSFAESVIDLIVPDGAGETKMTTVRESVESMPDSLLKSSLQALVKTAGDDIAAFRTSVERWYDDHMSRVSGWYKRRVAKITLVIGAILVVLLNINAITIGRTLYTDADIRTAVSTVAAQGTSCPAGEDQTTCLKDLQKQLSDAADAGLPIGWATVPDCPEGSGCNWLDQRGIFDHDGNSGWRVTLVIIGFLVTILALVPGARFWFDLLGRLGSLRTSGPKPPPAA